MATRGVPAHRADLEGGYGQVFIDIVVVNSFDLDRVVLGEARATDVRSIEIRAVLMDTGATHLCLPASMVSELGLALARTVPVETATGSSDRRVFRNALIRFLDRETQAEVVELPDGVRPLLGAIPMEAMGIQPDLATRTVRILPMTRDDTYITVL
jgi:predicted aspartyl protease